jgi:hypothetical protein
VSIAVVACEAAPHLNEDWPLVQDALRQLGISASAEVWTDANVDWSAFELVVVIGVWDYVSRFEEFNGWAKSVSQATSLINPAPVLRWNADKRYLADLSRDGVPTVPTEWVAPGQLWGAPSDQFVIKPTVSNGGFETARYSSKDLALAHVDRLHQAGLTVMVQPYEPAVDQLGETALVYLGGQFSHALRKGPLLELGAGVRERLWLREEITRTSPTKAELAVADSALSAAHRRAGPTTYARVDVVTRSDGTPCVLELELIEPSLFLRYCVGGPERFARVLRDEAARVRAS